MEYVCRTKRKQNDTVKRKKLTISASIYVKDVCDHLNEKTIQLDYQSPKFQLYILIQISKMHYAVFCF